VTIDHILEGEVCAYSKNGEQSSPINSDVASSIQIATEQNEKISPEKPELNEGEKELLKSYRQLTGDAQKMYLEVLRASLKNQSKD
jgi:hypothetical protein